MDHFQRRDGELWAEDVPLADIAARFGTPTYVYSSATLRRHVEVMALAFAALPAPPLLCYAVKANGTLAVLELLAGLECGFDAVSVGELARVLKAGGRADRTLLSGVGKRDDEIEMALAAGVLMVSVESEEELEACARIARARGTRAPVSLRVNPDVDAATHPYISTGLKQNKFGIPIDEARRLYRAACREPSLEPIGVGCHIGSQVTTLPPFAETATRMAELVHTLCGDGVPLRYVGLGGGLGVPYTGEAPPSPETYGETVAQILGPVLRELDLRLWLEPGRVIVGNAGVLLTRVTRKKRGAERNFVLLDAGMNDLVRPALYGARHALEPVAAPSSSRERVDVVGPVCESSDAFLKEVDLPTLATGELAVLRTAGAYAFAMSSNYNGRPRPAEVLVDGARATLVRQRETLADLWRGEHLGDGVAASPSLPSALTGRKKPTRRKRPAAKRGPGARKGPRRRRD